MPQNKLILPAFVISAAVGAYDWWAGAPFGQFLTVTLAGSDLALRLALETLPPGAHPVLLVDCVFALSYAFVLSLAANHLAPSSASPAAGKLLAQAVWLGAGADIAENVMLLRLLDDPQSVPQALLRAAAVLKFAIFIAACGWIGGAAWRAHLRVWSAVALAVAALVFFNVLPVLLSN